ncbi:plasmid segregation protein ParM [Xenorhabdus bovienii]|uniref:Plasmid segregation protein ParM n=1 Tax=Xenorhabdus bovienii TaxID=40576 RepID=A0AAJ1JCW2_XENBV|nr:plasmid segregation protein ParM domain-containing protein [Xenorhabdus bovienii]MDE1480256.1 plasmid segregation protein ParM [Xenorhabdus bovienii]MDE9511926.1 plasmid segregation protein ParM [Xenorhabdus bovienii]MDE9523568.1 plasmid segregation protein ParM [Xenorhabdus bovienii]
MKKSTDAVSDNAAVQKPALVAVGTDLGRTVVQQPILVAVDAGSGNIAVRFERDGKAENHIIPSRVQQGNAHSMALDAVTVWKTAGDNGEDVVFSVVTGGDELVNTCDPSYQISPAHRVLVINALAQLGLGGQDIILADTLPINQFYSDSGVIDQKRIDAKRNSLMKPVKNVSGKQEAPRILDVMVYPEGVPAYVSASVDTEMNPNPALEGAEKILIVDVGRFTDNIVELDKNYQIVRRGTFEHGVHIMLSRVHALLQEQAEELHIPEPKEIHIESIDMFIRQGYIGSRLKSLEDKRIKIGSVVQQAANEHADIIRSDIRNVRRNLSDLDVLILVGGGGNLLGGKLEYLADCTTEWGCPVYVPDNPEFAAVRGVHMALQADEEQILAELGLGKKEA